MRHLTNCMIVIMIAFSILACAGRSTPTFNTKYYPDCYDPIDKLCKDESYQQEIKETVGGAVIGALGGALVGLLATGGDWRGAAAGAVGGAVAGGAAGFFHARYQKIQDQNARLEAYQKDLGQQADRWGLERASVEKSYQCYRNQMRVLTTSWKNKQISKQAFLDRAAEIKAGVEHINTFWADAENRMNTTMVDGEKFIADEEKAAKDQAIKNRARATASRSKSTFSRQRSANSNINALKNETNTDLVALNKLVEASNELAFLFDNQSLMCVASR